MRRKQSGITLIELMITVGIVAILTAIAYPSYRQQVLRGNRTEAKAELMEASQELEKCYTRFGVYNRSPDCAAFVQLSNGVGRPSEGRRYQITLVAGGPRPATEYTLQAVPQNGQEVDTCGTLTIDQTGQRSSATPADTKCW